MMRRLLDSKGLILAALFGAAFFFLMYAEFFNPQNTDWLMWLGGDPAQHHIGWTFFRNSDWTFPIGIAQDYGYPIGIPMTYTDSVPLFAFVFKLFSSWLPVDFQYLGLFILGSMMLNGIFGYTLTKLVTKKEWVSVVASTLFVLSPITHFRYVGHTSLGAHWLVLWGLWLILRPHNKVQTGQWVALLLMCILIHPYIFFMCGPLMLIDMAQLRFRDKIASWKQIFTSIGIQIASVVAVGYSIGIFYIGENASVGYGTFSMNLLAPFIPMNWSRILPEISIGQYQGEGFNYLGIGVLFLIAASLIWYALKKRWQEPIKKHTIFITGLVILTLFAISHSVMVGPYEIFRIPLPESLTYNFLGVIRASGRMFWPVYYALMLFGFAFLLDQKKKVAFGIIAAAVALQMYDFAPRFQSLHEQHTGQTVEETLTSPFWEFVPEYYDHIAFIPKQGFEYEEVATYAYEQKLTLNAGYFAKPIKGENAHVEEQIKELLDGRVQGETLYIFPFGQLEYLHAIDSEVHGVFSINNRVLVVPNFYAYTEDIDTDDWAIVPL